LILWFEQQNRSSAAETLTIDHILSLD